MKVLSYLQTCDKGGFVDISLYLERLIMSDSVTEFYSQPFKPELITELFEGWKFVTINTRKQYQKYIEKDVLTIIAFSEYQYVINGVAYHIPRTLDDFINDVTRAGIELEWKNEN